MCDMIKTTMELLLLSSNKSTDLLSTTIPWNTTSVTESLAVMMHKERTVYKRCDYLNSTTLGLQDEGGVVLLDEEDRAKMVEWCYSVVDTCQLDREAVAMAMEMVDRFLSKKSSSKLAMDALKDRMQFQLLTMTALYISNKILNDMRMKTSPAGSTFFSIISRDLYNVEEIEAMECILLQELSWYISAPRCVEMAHHILLLISTHVTFDKTTWTNILNEVEFQAEYVVRDYYFVTQRASTVAMAVILNTLDRFFNKNKNTSGEEDIVHNAVLSVMRSSKLLEFESIDIILTTRAKLHSLLYGHSKNSVWWEGNKQR